MRVSKIFADFLRSERSGGVILIFCTAFSLVLTNVSSGYENFWHLHLNGNSITHWINDGLMTIFFLLIGLELEREIYAGELSTLRNASLPVIAAIGGMLIPAVLYYSINFSQGNTRGVGIPMATDIAFALGVLMLLGRRVPIALKIFLTALAVIDDLGAILVIAVFYTSTISWINLYIALGIFVVLLVLNRAKVHILLPYLIGGAVMWYFMHHSGVHATITGVLVAFAIPFDKGNARSISIRLQSFLHKPVAFFILPVFALANTSIFISNDFYTSLGSAVSLGILAGLCLGKPLGIFAFSYAAVKLKVCSLPQGMGWKHIAGAGVLGGIGFTMSIFIALLAFDQPHVIDHAKISVMLASLLSGIAGYLVLKTVLRHS